MTVSEWSTTWCMFTFAPYCVKLSLFREEKDRRRRRKKKRKKEIFNEFLFLFVNKIYIYLLIIYTFSDQVPISKKGRSGQGDAFVALPSSETSGLELATFIDRKCRPDFGGRWGLHYEFFTSSLLFFLQMRSTHMQASELFLVSLASVYTSMPTVYILHGKKLNGFVSLDHINVDFLRLQQRNEKFYY